MPCETVVWKVLPLIRRELVNVFINKYGMSQKEAAQHFNLTESAISQYMRNKRGCLKLNDERFDRQLTMSADILIGDVKPENMQYEICRLCHLIQDGPCWDDIRDKKESKVPSKKKK